MATGFHGAHVIIGTIFLIVCLVRALRGPVLADPASRLRVRRLVLALRRRGVAVPVRLHLCVGLRGGCRRGRARRLSARIDDTKGGGSAALLFWREDADDERATQGRRTRDRARPARALPALRRGQAVQGLSRPARPRASIAGSTTASPTPATGPAVFVILIGGFIVVFAAMAVEVAYSPPYWVHAALWLPLILLVTLGPLRPLKGLLIALQFITRPPKAASSSGAVRERSARARGPGVVATTLVTACLPCASWSASASGNSSARSGRKT